MTLRGTVQNSSDFQKRMRVMHKDYVVNGQVADPSPNPNPNPDPNPEPDRIPMQDAPPRLW